MTIKDKDTSIAKFGRGLVYIIVACGILLAHPPWYMPTAYAQHISGGHDSGGHDSGGHESGGSSGKGPKSGHKGPDPNCAFQDRTGRGGFGPKAQRGRGRQGGGHSSGHTDEGDHQSGGVHSSGGSSGHKSGGDSQVAATDPGSGIVGGGAGGEGYVCDGPGSWNVENKVLRR